MMEEKNKSINFRLRHATAIIKPSGAFVFDVLAIAIYNVFKIIRSRFVS